MTIEAYTDRDLTRDLETRNKVSQALKEKVRSFFEGIDIAQVGTYKKGPFDVVVNRREDNCQQAIASSNGIKLAEMVIPDRTTPKGFEFYRSEPSYTGSYQLDGVYKHGVDGIEVETPVSVHLNEFGSEYGLRISTPGFVYSTEQHQGEILRQFGLIS